LFLLNHKYGRYTLLIPILIALLATVYFYNLTNEINRTLLEEKFLEKQLELNLIDDLINHLIIRDKDWDTYDYQALLSDCVEFLDSQPFTFAALYSEALVNLSQRTPSYSELFNPFADVEFQNAVLTNEQGDYSLSYTPPEAASREMKIYYRWTPSDISLEERFLTIVAISEYSVTHHAANWVGWGAIALIIIVTVLNTVLIALISRLGSIYTQRNGDKWRKEIIS